MKISPTFSGLKLAGLVLLWFAALAPAAVSTNNNSLVVPGIASWSRGAGQFSLTVQHGPGYVPALWRASDVSGLTWQPLTQVVTTTHSTTSSTLTDLAATNATSLYRVETIAP